MFGAESTGPGRGVSSFHAFDVLIDWIQQHYKGLKEMVAIGFSAGGQMMMRWSVLSHQGAFGRTTRGIPLITIIGSPSTLLWLDQRRPEKSCRPFQNTGPDHNCSTFILPNQSFSPDDLFACNSKWDLYGYGLSGLKQGTARKGTIRQHAIKYLHERLPGNLTRDLRTSLQERWGSKDVRLLFGSRDVKGCGIGMCSSDCEAMLQGTSRLQRGLNFISHLKHVMPAYQPKYGIFEGGHSHVDAFLSHEFIMWAMPWNMGDYYVTDRLVHDPVSDLASFADRYYPAHECKEKCDQAQDCSSFDFDPLLGRCHLKRTCVSGSVDLVRPGSRFAIIRTYYKTCVHDQPNQSTIMAVDGTELFQVTPGEIWTWSQSIGLLGACMAFATLAGVAGITLRYRHGVNNEARCLPGTLSRFSRHARYLPVARDESEEQGTEVQLLMACESDAETC